MTPKTLAPCDHDECGPTGCTIATDDLSIGDLPGPDTPETNDAHTQRDGENIYAHIVRRQCTMAKLERERNTLRQVNNQSKSIPLGAKVLNHGLIGYHGKPINKRSLTIRVVGYHLPLTVNNKQLLSFKS